MAQRRRVALTVLGAFLAIAVSASAAIAAPSFFSTQNECEKAVIAGVYEVYPPRYFKNHAKDPVDGVTRIAAPIEFTACVHMKTMTGKKEWVVQAPGTMLRFRVAPDGSLTPYARHDCGNEIDRISYPQEVVADQSKNVIAQKERETEAPTQSQQVVQAPIRDVCAERGLFGERFTNRIDERGRPYCNEDISWYETTMTKYVVGTVVVGAVGYCAISGRCGFWKRGGGGGGSSILTGPSGGGTGIGGLIGSGGGIP